MCPIIEYSLPAGQGAGAENVKHQSGARSQGGRGRGGGHWRHSAAPGTCCGQDGDTGQTREPFVILSQSDGQTSKLETPKEVLSPHKSLKVFHTQILFLNVDEVK